MRRTLLILVAALIPSTLWAQDDPARWTDARTARIIERYVEILLRRPLDGPVFRKLATIYDNAGRLNALDERLKQAAETDRDTNACEILRGHLARYRGDADAASAFYRSALERKGPTYLANAGLGRALEDLGRWKDAEDAYTAAIAAIDEAKALGLDVADETSTLTRALGRVALRAGRTDAARTYWNRLVELEPGNPERLRELAQLLADNRLFDDAVETMKRFIDASADDPGRRAVGWRDLGGICERAERTDEALEAYRRALSLTAPGNWLRREINDRVLRLAERTGTLKDLEEQLAERVKASPDDGEAWRQLARVRTSLADREGLIEACRNLVRLSPKVLSVRLAQARRLEEAGAWTEAAVAWRGVIELAPKGPVHRFDLARVLMKAGDALTARKIWEALGEDFGADAVVQLRLGRAWEDASLFLDAEKAYVTAVAADPDTFACRRELGEFYLRRGRRHDAETAWRAAAVARPRDAEVHVALGEVFRRHGMLDDALRAFRKAAELRPKDMQRWRDVAGLCLEMDLPNDAVAAWERVSETAVTDRERDEAWEQVLGIHEARDRLAELVADYEKRLKRDPHRRRTTLRLARALERTGDTTRAVLVYRSYLAGHPKDVWLLANLARVHRRDGRAKQAMTIYHRLIDLDAANARSHLTDCINAALDADLANEALKAGHDLVERYPHDVRAWLELARVQELLKRFDPAIETLGRAAALRPDDGEVLAALSRMYEVAGDLNRLEALHRRVVRSAAAPETMLESARRLIDLTYATPAFDALETLFARQVSGHRREFARYRALAEFLLADERPDEAKAVYRRALTAVPASSRGHALEALSRLASQLGDVDEAIRYGEDYARTAPPATTDHLPVLAALCLRAGRVDKARRSLRTWSSRDPGNREVHRTVADISLKHGDVAGAVDAMKRQLALPAKASGEQGLLEHHRLRLRVAGLLERIKRFDEAQAMYLEVLDKPPFVLPPPDGPASLGVGPPVLGAGLSIGPLTPGPPATGPQGPTYGQLRLKAIEGLVQLAVRRGRADAVVKLFEQRLAATPGREQPYDDLVRVLERLGRDDAMIDVVRRARKRFGATGEWLEILAWTAMQKGRHEEALKAYRELRRSDPHERFTTEVVELLLQLKRPKEVQTFARGLLDAGEGAQRLKEVAEVCTESGEHALAAHVLELTIAAFPRQEIHYRLEIVERLHAAGKPDKAYRSLKRYIDLTRANPGVPFSAVTQRSRLGELARAWRSASLSDRRRLPADLEDECSKRSKDAVLLFDLSFVYARTGRGEDEGRMLERLLEITGNEAFAPDVLRAWLRAGRVDDARDFVTRMLSRKGSTTIADFAVHVLRQFPGLTPDDATAKKLVEVILASRTSGGRAEVARFYRTHSRGEAAVELLRRLVEENPLDVLLRLQLADALKELGRDDEAEADARKAAGLARVPPDPELDPDEEATLYTARRNQLRDEMDRFAERGYAGLLVERLRKLQRAMPDSPTCAVDLALAQEAAGDSEAALETLRRLRAKKPDDLQLSLAVVKQLQVMGRNDEAVRRLERLVEVTRPARLGIYDALAAAHARAGDRDAEMRVRRRKAMIFRRYEELADVARQQTGLGRRDEALSIFRKYMRLRYGPMSIYGDGVTSSQEYAQFLRQAGFHEKAVAVLERTLSVLPAGEVAGDEPGPLYDQLTPAYQALGRLDELIRRVEQKLRKHPEDVVAWKHLADLHAARGDTSAEIDARQAVLERRPSDVNNLTRLAQAFRRRRRFDEAIAAYRKLLTLDPGGATAYLTPIAEMYYEKDEHPRAAATVEQMLSDRCATRRSLSERLQSAALLYGMFGLYDKEEAAYRRLLSVARHESPYPHVTLVRALLKRGRIDRACEVAVEGLTRFSVDWQRVQILNALFGDRGADAARLVRIGGVLERSALVSAEPALDLGVARQLHTRLLQLGRTDLAVGCLLRAWHRHRGEGRVALDAAAGLLDLGRLTEAAGLLDTVAPLPDERDELLLLKVRLDLLRGRLDEAERGLAGYLRTPRTPAQRLRVGAMLVQAGYPARAVGHLEAARQSDADYLALAFLGEVLMHLGEHERLKVLWHEALKGTPEAAVLRLAGRSLLRTGDLSGAGKVFRNLRAMNMSDRDTLRGLAEVLRRQGKGAEAIELHRETPDFFIEGRRPSETDGGLLRLYREARTLSKVIAEAQADVTAADADWSRALLELAGRLAAAGRTTAAVAAYRRLLDVSRDEAVRKTAAERLKALAPPGGR